MNDLKIFSNKELGGIRVLEKDGQPWFVGKDIASVLGYGQPHKALKAHVDEDDGMKYTIIDTIGRKQEMIIINESGLYSLILSSKLPKAKTFKHWVTSEVLPSIRKTGAYNSNSNNQTQIIMNMVEEITKTFVAQLPNVLSEAFKASMTSMSSTISNVPMETETPKRNRRKKILCAVERLPDEIKTKVDDMLLQREVSYQYISDELKNLGYSISKSSIGNYAIKFYDRQ